MLVEQVMGERKAYPSDLTDEQWAAMGPFLDAWKAKHPPVSVHQGRCSLREILNSIFYQNRTGCQWAYLPHDLPPKSATYFYFALWRDDGTDQVIHDLLRCQARETAGRREDPSAIIMDTQSIRAANHVPAATTGRDAGKKAPGRKRGLAVDALGLIIAVVVTAASVTDTVIGVRLLDKVVEHTPTVTRAWVDAGFKHDLGIHGGLAVISEPYQQILAVFTPDRGGLRAKDVCRVLGIGTEPKDTEGVRAKLKRLVNRQILTESQPGPFTLDPERT